MKKSQNTVIRMIDDNCLAIIFIVTVMVGLSAAFLMFAAGLKLLMQVIQ